MQREQSGDARGNFHRTPILPFVIGHICRASRESEIRASIYSFDIPFDILIVPRGRIFHAKNQQVSDQGRGLLASFSGFQAGFSSFALVLQGGAAIERGGFV